MARDEGIHVGDIGTVLERTITDDGVVVDVSAATDAGEKVILFHKPDGTLLTEECTFTTDGTDGKIRYTAVSGFFDVKGSWTWQGKVTLGTSVFHTDRLDLVVRDTLS